MVTTAGGEQGSSATGAFGRALRRVGPGQLSQSDQAYLRFILLALHNSLKEARRCLENTTLVLEVLSGMDLLIENAERRFGLPPSSARDQAMRSAPREEMATQLRLEAVPLCPGSSSPASTESGASHGSP